MSHGMTIARIRSPMPDAVETHRSVSLEIQSAMSCVTLRAMAEFRNREKAQARPSGKSPVSSSTDHPQAHWRECTTYATRPASHEYHQKKRIVSAVTNPLRRSWAGSHCTSGGLACLCPCRTFGAHGVDF